MTLKAWYTCIWGVSPIGTVCFSASGTGRLVRIEGKMNKAKFKETLDKNLLHSAQDLRVGPRFTFQQDNAPQPRQRRSHKSLNVLEWSSESPDMNPIKHLWRDLKIAVQRCSPSNLTELERICREEREKLKKISQNPVICVKRSRRKRGRRSGCLLRIRRSASKPPLPSVLLANV
jgi:hypothetical protein